MRKKYAISLAIGLAASTAGLAYADVPDYETLMLEGQHTTHAIPAIPTSSYVGDSHVIKVAQIAYPNVYVWPAFPEKWFSTVRVCNTLGNPFAGKGQLPIKIQVFNNAGTEVKAISKVVLQPNSCLSYTSDVPADPLFGGLSPGVYSVAATVIAHDSDELLEALNYGGNLNGSVNSTARDYLKS